MPEPAFEVTSVTTLDVGDKLDVRMLETWLNENFNLPDYGPGVEQIFVIFTEIPAGHVEREKEILYLPDEKMVQFILPLSHQKLKEATMEEATDMMFSSLMDTINELAAASGSSFGWAAFRRDLLAKL